MPQRGYSYEKLAPLDNDYNIGRQIEGIYGLLELETAGKLLLASQLRANGMILLTLLTTLTLLFLGASGKMAD